MRRCYPRTLSHLLLGVSTLAIAGLPSAALAQDQASAAVTTAGQPDDSTQADTAQSTDIVVTGIRASLENSMNLKRNAQGVVDAISAEDIGKFPDTNLAESLQRITGVSIDRSNGEGQFVTVRGFGPEFNLVLLNGREMPTSTIGDGFSAPGSRSFDFANLASEGVKALEVYKSGRVTLPTGGIGSVINIITPRPLDKPGLRGSVTAKGILDTSRNGKDPITPEVSGIISDTFADNRIGILLIGEYSRRKASVNQANVGYRDGYLGSENNWGSLPQAGDPRYANITNRPGPNDVYQVAQNASYDLNDIDRERINGQAVLQFRPSDALTATIDYTYSRYNLQTHNSNVGIYYNHADTSSAWTDGPIADPIFYSEHFQRNENKDLSYSGALTDVRNENKSLGGNLVWNAPGGVTVTLDAHHSTATSKPGSKYGNSQSVGTAIFGIEDQSINFEHDFPVISASFYPDVDPLDASQIHATGNVFRNSYFRDRINQVRLDGHYDHQGDFLDSIDWGVSYVNNHVRSAYGYIQNDTWSGLGTPADIPDDFFTLETLPDKFKGLSGSQDPAAISQFYTWNFNQLVPLLDQKFGICGGDGNCLADYTTDRRITEKTLAPFLQVATKFDLLSHPAHLIAGVRYETTDILSSAQVPAAIGTEWISANELHVIQPKGQYQVTTFKGHYQNWLPAVDFDVSPTDSIKLRASYSHTITRPDYGSLQGGRTLDQLFRVGYATGTGSQGNPGLLPYKSKNIDLSAEWYYGRDSYISVGYFRKKVANFISSTRFSTDAFGLTNPTDGPFYREAVAAIGATATSTAIRQYIYDHHPSAVQGAVVDANGNLISGSIAGTPNDNPLIFQITTPVNSDQTATLNGWEFAVQNTFWNTGFGVILNYTIVNGDATYDNTQPASVTQFALTGLSDSANAVLFYDKGPIQARVAYNWRDQFLSASGPNPTYIEPYGQLDASASVDITSHFNVFVEGINLTGEDRRGHTRSDAYVTFISPGAARYSAGVRFIF